MADSVIEEKKRLLTNFFSLALIRGSSMILPLITLPYLVRVLGAENFGLINFTLATIMYFDIFVGFGFELSATREISINRDNMEKVSEIFSSVIIIKLIFVMISLCIFSFMVFFFEGLRVHATLYFVTFGIVVGNALFPIWFFQGIEQMKYITYFSLSNRILYTLFIFILVQDQSDYIYVPLLNSIGAIAVGIVSIWMILKYYPVRFFLPSREIIYSHIKDSYHFFLSRVAKEGSRHFATTIIGIYFGNTIVGYYAMVSKLLGVFSSLGGIVAQTIYPYMSKTKNIVMYKKIFTLVLLISITLWIPVVYYRDFIIILVFHLQNDILSNIFLVMFSSAIIGIIGSLIGYPLLAALGYTKYANNSLIIASIINVVYIILVAKLTNNIYLTVASVIVFDIVTVLIRYYYIKKTRIFTIMNPKVRYDRLILSNVNSNDIIINSNK